MTKAQKSYMVWVPVWILAFLSCPIFLGTFRLPFVWGVAAAIVFLVLLIVIAFVLEKLFFHD